MSNSKVRPPICDYEGSDYQTRFWDHGSRFYEDRCEAIAIKRLLPKKGDLLLELGAGAGRNTSRYSGYQRVVLLDYSTTQLQQAQNKLGNDKRYIYVAADIYNLPFKQNLFDTATMIRVLHHMADPVSALKQIRAVLRPGSSFILEYANKRNIKSILRYIFGKQQWNPFNRDPIEFAPLNFDFHPTSIKGWLSKCGFSIERILTVSHFRINILKRILPVKLLIGMDSVLQWSGGLVQLTPSVFIRSRLGHKEGAIPFVSRTIDMFNCPACKIANFEEGLNVIKCNSCGSNWPIENGIFNFK